MSSIVQKCSQRTPRARIVARFGLLAFLLTLTCGLIPEARAQAPANDNFANALNLTPLGTPGTFSGTTLGATRQTNEPIHYIGSPFSSNSVWFSWTAPATGIVTFDTIGTYGLFSSNFVFGFLDTILAAYRLQGTNGLGSLVKLASDDDSGGGLYGYDSQIQFAVQQGTNYFIAIDGYNGGLGGGFSSTGPYILNWRMGVNPPISLDTFRFSSTNYSVSEAGLIATITVLYGGDSSGGANGPVSVDFFTTNGTAIDGTHYLGTNGTLVFATGETEKTFDVQILDNTNLNNNKIVLLGLANPTNATLDFFFSSAVLTIIDDEAPFLSTAGQFNFTSTSYIGTENETDAALFGGFAPAVDRLASCIIRDVNLPAVCHRSPDGVVITVTRSAPAIGRVLVDYTTEVRPVTNIFGPILTTTFPAKRGVDFTPTTGTLVFDDYQMSASVIVPVFSNFVSNNASAIFSIVLSNPRPDPEEETNAPDTVVPTLGSQAEATITIYEVNQTFKRFNFERALYRYDEYNPLQNTIPSTNGSRTVTVDVLLPGGGGGSVGVRMLHNTTASYLHQLQAGSDYATLDADTFENTPYTDGTRPIVTESDFSDFQQTTLTFPGNGLFQFRQRATFTITNDNTPEFNEDVTFELVNVPNGFSSGPNFESTVTILFDDQPAGAADREWNPEFVYYSQPPYNTTPGANNTVSGVAVQDDSRTVIVGDFTAVNSVSRNRIARFNANGSLDQTFNPGSGANGPVEAIVLYPTNSPAANLGKMLVGGSFTSFNGISRRGLVRLLPNGSVDSSFNVGNGANGPVRSIALQSDGKVIVAGDFALFNDLSVNGIMRLNVDGSLDDTFNPGTGANDTIWSVAVRDTSVPFVVARRSRSTTGEDRNLIDTGSTQGSITIDYDFTPGADNIRVYFDGARIFNLTTNGTGQVVVPYGPGVSTSVEIVMDEAVSGAVWFYQATVTPNVLGRSVYLAGEFTSFNGQSLRGVARLNDNGSVDASFNSGVSVDGPVYTMAVQPNNRVLLGGSFAHFHNSSRNSLVRVLSDGSLDLDFHVGTGANDAVYALTVESNGKIYIGGAFQSYNGTRRMGIARLFSNGALDTSFMDTAYNQFAGLIKTYSFDAPRYVNAIGLQADGNVMIGGSFTNVGGNFSYNNPRFATDHLHAPFTRADKVAHFNVARLIGGYTDGPGNIEFDPSSMPFSVDENAGFFAAPLRRVDGRLGSAFASSLITSNTASIPDDVFGSIIDPSWPEAYFIAPRSVGFTGFNYFEIPITDDGLREGDETFDLATTNVRGSINLGNDFFSTGLITTLGGEFIPLGAARGYFDSVNVTIADNDFDHGEFNFALSDFVVVESSGLATVTVIRTNGSSGPVSVRVMVRDGTATAGQDYVAPAGLQTLSFASGQTSNTFTVQLLDNFQIEPDETIVLVLTNAAGGATLPGGLPSSVATATITIIDNDFLAGRLRFATAGFTNSENERFAAVTVRRVGGNSGVLSVNFQTLNGSATAPADFTATNGILSWNSGDSSPRTILVPLVSDGIVEGDETFTLRLFNPSVANALGDGIAQLDVEVTIADGDAYGSLSFSQSIYEADENGAAPIITIVRRGGVGGTVSVDFSTAPGTAIEGPGGDYLNTNGTLVFLPGELSKTFRIPLIDDNTNDLLKTVLLTLSNPTLATLGTVSNSVLNIVDNEDISTPAGSLDTTFSTASGANGAVFSLALQSDSAIVMAGEFTAVGSVPRNRIARLHPDGTLDASFDVGPGANGPIRALGLQSDGRLIVGGSFSTINSTNVGNLARLGTDGKVDSAFNPGSGADNPVFALAVQPDDKVLAGGSFSSFNGQPSPGLVRLGTNGLVDFTFNTGAGFNGTVYAIALQDDGKILVGGDFVAFNGAPHTNLVRLLANGTPDATFNSTFAANGAVRAILIQSDGNIVVGGSFTSINGVTRRYLARLDQTGVLDATFLAGASMGADSTVDAIKQQIDGKLLVAGDFRTFNGVTRGGITRLRDSDGSTDPTINFGSGANGFISALLLQPDRKIVLGGGFTEYDAQPRQFVARIYGGAIAGPGTIEFAAPEYIAGESSTNAFITVSRRGGTEGIASAAYTTLDGTAVAGRDYQTTTGIVVFAEGETRRTILVQIIPNALADGDRTAYLQLFDFVNASVGLQPYTSLIIIDDESVISFNAMNYSVNENSINGKATIGVIRSGGTNTTVVAGFSTADGSALAGLDYVGTNGTVTFLPGERFKNFNVIINDDGVVENNETVLLSLSSLSASALLNVSNAVLVIVDNDFAPGNFIFATNNFGVDEFGGNAFVTILRTNGSSGPASVRLQTQDGNAISGVDYTATDRTVTFADGETAKIVSIPIVNDTIFEADESFTVILSDPQPQPGTSILTPTALVTIVDDEFGPSYVAFASSNFLGSELNGFVDISVIRTNTRRGVVSVSFATSDGTATSADYFGTNGTITFADGEILKTFRVRLINDGINEAAETVNLRLFNLSSGFLSLSNATLSIADNSLPLQFSSPNYSVSENVGTATITVTRQGSTAGSASVDFSTVPGGTAIGGLDYVPASGTLTWAAGDGNPKTFTVQIIDNTSVNPPKTVFLLLSNASGVASSTLTITDDDSQNPVSGVVDPTFDQNFGANARVRAVAFDDQQRLYVGGDFTQFHGLAINRLTRLTTGGAVDINFKVGSGVDAAINSIAPVTNAVYIAGAFTNVGGVPRGHVARLYTDGFIDTGFAPISGANAVVNGVATTRAQDKVIIGGDFTTYDGVPAPRIARLNTNGTLDSTFVVGSGPNSTVRAVAVQTNGQVLIGGTFSSVNGFIVTRLARLNADGSVDTTFDTGLGVDDAVSSIAVGADGKILIAGEFLTVNGVPRNGVARLNSNGSVDTSFIINDGPDALVRAVAVELDNHVIIAGDFMTFDGNPSPGVARLNPDGSLDSGFVIGTGADAPVNAIGLISRCVPPPVAVMNFNSLPSDFTAYTNYTENCLNIRGLTGGHFHAATNDTRLTAAEIFEVDGTPQELTLGGFTFSLQSIYFTNLFGTVSVTSSAGAVALVSSNGIFTFDASFSGAVWVRLDVSGVATIDDVTVIPGVDALVPQTFAIGGDFEKFNNVQRGGVAVLTTSGTAFPTFDPRNIATRSVFSSAIYTNTTQPSLVGKVVVGGDFTAIVGVDGVNRLARLNIDGTLDTSFSTGFGPNGVVRAVALQPDGKVVFGGFFTSYDFLSRAYLARANVDGSLDNTFNFGAGLDNAVLALALQPDGRIVIGGVFTTVYGVARNSFARVNANGTVDVTFTVGTGANGAVKAVALQSDGKILIGGDFTSFNGTLRGHIARLNTNGTLDATFNPSSGADGAVNAIALTSTGQILIGGAFTTVNGTFAPRLARLTSSGAVDGTFNTGSGANDSVNSIVIQPDGRVLIGGNFTVFNGQIRNRLVRLNSDGSLDPSVNFGAGANDFISTISLQQYDGKIIVGGGFTEFDGITRVAVARLFGGTNSGSGTFSFSSLTYTANERSSNAVLTVVRSGGAQGAASVSFSTANGTATSPADYTATSGTLNFADAETVKQILVPLNDNTSADGDRIFSVSLSNPSPGTSLGSPSTAQVTIVDNESLIAFSSASYLVNENATVARITVTRSGGAIDTATVNFETGTNGTATAGVDFSPRSGTLVFAPGVRTRTFDVPILDDTVNEFNETIPLFLSNPSGSVVLGLSNATLTIVENDFGAGTVGFSSSSYFISEDGGGGFAIQVVRTNGYSGAVTVNYQTLTGSATPNVDYQATNGVLTFVDGQTNAFITIYPIDDLLTEGNETVPLQLFGASGGATLGLANTVVTIVDNDAPGTFVFSAPTYTVSEAGGSATITVLRTNGNLGAASVTVQTSGGTATPTLDYQPVSNVLSFANGQSSRTFTIPIIQDGSAEGTETVFLLLSNPTGGQGIAVGAPNPATLFITDDESSIGFSAGNYDVVESLTNVVITLVRIGDTNLSASVTVSTSDGTATAGADYLSTSATVTFAPGETSRLFTVGVFDDTLAEGDETVNLTLSSASSGVALGPISTATLTILDNDTSYSFSSATYSTNESTVDLAITVRRSGPTNLISSVDYFTSDGSATSNLDYLTATGRLAFAAGQSSAVFNVRILDDLLVENNETINLTLTNPSANTFLGPQSTAVIVILDNDTTVGFSQTNYVVSEKVTNAVITLVRNGASSQTVAVGFRTQNGTAQAGVNLDYLAVTNYVIWQPNDVAPKTILIPINDDTLAEGAETVLLFLSNPFGATIDPAASSSVLTIVDNAGSIAFASANSTVVEGSGNAVVNLVRSGGANGTVTVQWNVTGGSATPGQDYFGTSGTVVFANGETTKPIILAIGDDGLAEGVETVNFSLSNATGGARVGSPSTATLSILDNDTGLIIGAGSALISESFLPTNNIIEPGETVTLLFALRNAGSVDAGNVTASLVYANGVTNGSPQTQNYGALIAGGNSVSRPFTFTALGSNGTHITATLLITNNGLFLGPVSFDFVLGVQNIPFQNAGVITIPDSGPATPFPSTLTVSGVSGGLTKLTVTLNSVTHSFPDDLDIVLVAPNGTRVMLMSDAGGTNALNNVTITFDDAAPVVIPDSGAITNGLYRCFNYSPTNDSINPPFPSGTIFSNVSLASLIGINPNGTWSLYVYDDSSGDNGSINGGWSLNINASDPVIPGADLAVTLTDAPDPVTTNSVVTYTISVSNYGPAPASAVMLTNILPTGATFLNVNGPGNYTLNGNVLVGSLGNIGVNGSAVVIVTMRASSASGQLTFDSTVGAGTADLNSVNNHVSVKTSVNEGAALPTLFATRKNGQIVLSWQDASTNVVLQSAGVLSVGSWADTAGSPVVSNGVSTVTAPMNAGVKFYRLRRVP